MNAPDDRQAHPATPGPAETPHRAPDRAQWSAAALIAAFSISSVVYKVLMHQHLGHSAAMFLGLPAILAILLALAPRADTATGGILKGITLALLLLAPLLGEGYLCILVAAPLFYAVGLVIGLLVDHQRSRRKATLCCAVIFLLPMCLEGVAPELAFRRSQTVESTRIVPASSAAVERALAGSLRVETPLTTLLAIGFPRPLRASGSGLAPGSTRIIHFSGAEGDPPGDLVMTVAEHRPGYLRFTTLSDASKLTQWIRWTSSEVEWHPLDSTHTAVTWRIHFDRQLDPAWYFTPWERAAAREAATYLISANATP